MVLRSGLIGGDVTRVYLCVKARLCFLCNRLRKEVRRAHTRACRLESKFVKAVCSHSWEKYNSTGGFANRCDFYMVKVSFYGRALVEFVNQRRSQKWKLKLHNEAYFKRTLRVLLESLHPVASSVRETYDSKSPQAQPYECNYL